jgi:peroxiredoxin
VLLSVAVGGVAGCSLPGTGPSRPQAAPSKPAPDFRLAGLDGRDHALGDYRGKVVVLNFWATWCIPCRAEIPDLEHEHRAQDPGKVAIVGIDWKESAVSAQSFIHDIGATYPTLLDADGRVYDQYGVSALPQTFVLDAGGKIVSSRTGIASRDQMEAEIRAAGG